MDKIKYPSPIDLAPFAKTNTHPSTKYGLPSDVAYCKKCVISNQRPNSAVEYKHTKDSKKVTMKRAFAMPAASRSASIRASTGLSVRSACVNYATSIASMMAPMTA